MATGSGQAGRQAVSTASLGSSGSRENQFFVFVIVATTIKGNLPFSSSRMRSRYGCRPRFVVVGPCLRAPPAQLESFGQVFLRQEGLPFIVQFSGVPGMQDHLPGVLK
jgi:hypothetical protein